LAGIEYDSLRRNSLYGRERISYAVQRGAEKAIERRKESEGRVDIHRLGSKQKDRRRRKTPIQKAKEGNTSWKEPFLIEQTRIEVESSW